MRKKELFKSYGSSLALQLSAFALWLPAIHGASW